MRAQAHTLEAISAALLVVGSVVFALQVTAVTPLSASTSSQHIENQQESMTAGVLSHAAEDESLKRAVLFWNEADGRFHDAGPRRPYYTNAPPPPGIEFGRLLDRTYGPRGIAYNVRIGYQPPGGGFREIRYISRGEPSDNAVTTSTYVTLFDDDVLHNPGVDANGDGVAEPTGSSLSTANFYASDVSSSSDVYNVLRVEVIVWGM
ncbi:hypothetical protein SAMN04487948_10230 [Halogranum amylolyticum]|uniref:Uncharacterized protein n=1 Tax=Halogranum amylolyticum TaxID=660520 RepID=A0A1H8P0S9_9EURY|nr:hypothetical protein [Halogranum amylolyticum]SEO35499.1 hypothetical protein SAMN04487948_10230 [Halogranum amylolyticum]